MYAHFILFSDYISGFKKAIDTGRQLRVQQHSLRGFESMKYAALFYLYSIYEYEEVSVLVFMQVGVDGEGAGPLQEAFGRLAYPDENARPGPTAGASPAAVADHMHQVQHTHTAKNCIVPNISLPFYLLL